MDTLDFTETWAGPGRLAIGGSTYDAGSPDLAGAIAWAYAARRRPRCLCRPDGVEMYVARFGERYVVKRMPDTGNNHAPGCPSFAPPAECSGLHRLLGTAIIEDPVSGMTTLKLGFPMSARPGSKKERTDASTPGSFASGRTRLSLRGLLFYLWEQSDLTRWHPRFEGRRNWRTVRHHLLRAAEHIVAGGGPLRTKLYIPETFSSDLRDQIIERRRCTWNQSASPLRGSKQLMLLIAEVKELASARRGARVVLKHIPDIAFSLDESLLCSVEKRFPAELELWSASDDLHLLTIATFGMNDASLPKIHGLSLVPVTHTWLPLESGPELELLRRLVHEQRSFTKVLRHHTLEDDEIPSVLLTDCGNHASAVYAAEGTNRVVPPRVTSRPSASAAQNRRCQ